MGRTAFCQKACSSANAPSDLLLQKGIGLAQKWSIARLSKINRYQINSYLRRYFLGCSHFLLEIVRLAAFSHTNKSRKIFPQSRQPYQQGRSQHRVGYRAARK